MDAFEKTMCRSDLNLKVPQRRDLQEFATSVQLTLQMNKGEKVCGFILISLIKKVDQLTFMFWNIFIN